MATVVLDVASAPYRATGLNTPWRRFFATFAAASLLQLAIQPDLTFQDGEIRPWAYFGSSETGLEPSKIHFWGISALAGVVAAQLL